jgi:hypothetical protein
MDLYFILKMETVIAVVSLFWTTAALLIGEVLKNYIPYSMQVIIFRFK